MDKLTGSASTISHIVAITMFVIATCACKTIYAMCPFKMSMAGLEDTVLTDRDGNRYPIKKMPDNNLWMTVNLQLNMPGSYCYENVKENCERYGRLYTWESAQKGCLLLGEGWRLPTNDEWQQLVRYYGVAADTVEYRKSAYKALLYGGSAEFNALLGGGRAPDSQYARLDAHGFYWTATQSDTSTAWFYNFGKGSQALYQQDAGEKTRAFSVRCMKKMDRLK